MTGPVVEFSVDLETPSALLLLSPRAGVVVDNRSAEVGPVLVVLGLDRGGRVQMIEVNAELPQLAALPLRASLPSDIDEATDTCAVLLPNSGTAVQLWEAAVEGTEAVVSLGADAGGFLCEVRIRPASRVLPLP